MKRKEIIILVSIICLSLIIVGIIHTERTPAPPLESEAKQSELESPVSPEKVAIEVIETSLRLYNSDIKTIAGVKYCLVGEVQNNGPVGAWGVNIIAKFYDNRGYVVAQRNADDGTFCLIPRDKKPFLIEIYSLPSTYTRYVVEAECTSVTTAYSPLQGIEILNVKEVIRPVVMYGVTLLEKSKGLEVEIHNTADKEQFFTVIATFYDSQGRVLTFTEARIDLVPNGVTTVYCEFSRSESESNEFPDYSLSIHPV